MTDRLKSHIQDWQDMASFDPLRAISGQKKDWQVEAFWATAQPHMEQLFSTASLLGLPKSNERALEFGCGAGRFLPYFEKRFREVWGLDVSPSMIDLAKSHNPRCKFLLNTAEDLGFFPANHFDLVYSFLVLQHLPNRFLIARYLKDFIRVLKPGGLAVFQIPDRLSLRWRIQPRRRAYHLLHYIGVSSNRLQSWGLLPMSLMPMSEKAVQSIISAAGGKVSQEEKLSGTEGIFYYCTK
ncbi:MAG TPA: class I SAM-dependent methyltransferase [Candidatus Angelobacter sp.]